MVKRVILFNKPLIKNRLDKAEEADNGPRIGIASMAAYLLKNKIEVDIIDTEDAGSARKRLKEYNPDLVGIPAYTPEVYDSAYTAQIIKETLPKSIVVVGGAHPSAMRKETLEEFGIFDIAVAGEGEQVLLDIASAKPLEAIEGIAYRDKDGSIKSNGPRTKLLDLHDIPFPDWNLYDMDRYRVPEDQGEGIFSSRNKKNRIAIQIEFARGCPFDCIFCFRISGKSIRYRPPSAVAEEIKKNVERYGHIKVYFIEGTFGIDRNMTLQLCDAIMEKGLNRKIIWEASSRVDVVNKEMLVRMKEAGCRNIGFGIESGDPDILRKVGKNTTPQKIIDAINLCNQVGIQVGTTFILGHPYETRASIIKTIKFAKRLPVATTNFAIMVPFPGTEVRRMAVDNVGGLRIRSNDWRYYGKQIGYAMELEQIPHKELLSLQNRAYFEFYFRPGRIKYFLKHLTWGRIAFACKRLFRIG